MTRQVLFIQGAGEGAYAEDAELAASLRHALGDGYEVNYPSMPDEADPSLADWGDRIRSELASLGAPVILVGHSAGAVALMSFLATSRHGKGQVACVVLVSAPFFGEGGWEGTGFELPRDLARLLPDAPVLFFHGTEDEIAPVAHLGLYAEVVPQAAFQRLEGRDHQLGGDMSDVAATIRTLA